MPDETRKNKFPQYRLYAVLVMQKKPVEGSVCYKEILDASMEDFDEIGRTYEAELTTLKVELKQRSPVPSAMEAECTQLRSRVASLKSELADLTQRFIVSD